MDGERLLAALSADYKPQCQRDRNSSAGSSKESNSCKILTLDNDTHQPSHLHTSTETVYCLDLEGTQTMFDGMCWYYQNIIIANLLSCSAPLLFTHPRASILARVHTQHTIQHNDTNRHPSFLRKPTPQKHFFLFVAATPKHTKHLMFVKNLFAATSCRIFNEISRVQKYSYVGQTEKIGFQTTGQKRTQMYAGTVRPPVIAVITGCYYYYNFRLYVTLAAIPVELCCCHCVAVTVTVHSRGSCFFFLTF